MPDARSIHLPALVPKLDTRSNVLPALVPKPFPAIATLQGGSNRATPKASEMRLPTVQRHQKRSQRLGSDAPAPNTVGVVLVRQRWSLIYSGMLESHSWFTAKAQYMFGTEDVDGGLIKMRILYSLRELYVDACLLSPFPPNEWSGRAWAQLVQDADAPDRSRSYDVQLLRKLCAEAQTSGCCGGVRLCRSCFRVMPRRRRPGLRRRGRSAHPNL